VSSAAIALGAHLGAFFLPAGIEIYSGAPIKSGRPGVAAGGPGDIARPILARGNFGRRGRRRFLVVIF
jgi:hypothetical protein